jgi:hypothetical protein
MGSNDSTGARAAPGERGQEGDKGDTSNRERSAGIVKPIFVDNRDGNTLARAITTHFAALRRAWGALQLSFPLHRHRGERRLRAAWDRAARAGEQAPASVRGNHLVAALLGERDTLRAEARRAAAAGPQAALFERQ